MGRSKGSLHHLPILKLPGTVHDVLTPCPNGAVFHFLHWSSKMLGGRSDYAD